MEYVGYISFSFTANEESADSTSDAQARLEGWIVKKAEEIGFTCDLHDGDCWEDESI